MIILNLCTKCENAYILTLGEECYKIYAQSEVKAKDLLAEHLVYQNDFNSFFDALEVELMAKSVQKSITDFVADTDLYHCPKYNIYLPKLKVQEVAE